MPCTRLMRVGLDIGGTKTDAVAVDDADNVVARLTLPTRPGEEGVLAAAATAVTRLAESGGESVESFLSVGVGIPGLVTPATGRVRHAVNLGLEDFELAQALSARLGIGVHVENDVNAAAMGVSHLMQLKGSVAYLNLGTGLAAGFVSDGQLWRGGRGTAGEIGHIPVDPQGTQCACGQTGCLETLASGSAVARLWPTRHSHPAHELFAAAEAGDERARALKARFGEGVAAAVRILVLTADVDTVIVGGGLSRLGAPLLAEVRRALLAQASTSSFVASLELAERIKLLPAELPAAAVGAALVGRRDFATTTA